MCHFAINPIFQHYTKHFLKEALRLSHKSCFYYPIYPSDSSQKVSATVRGGHGEELVET